jgi:hypothetical protein
MSQDPYPATDKVSAAAWVAIVAGIFAVIFLFAVLG